MSNYVSDVDLDLTAGEFALILSSDEPADLAGARWVQIPEDASSVVVREYIGDPASEELATMRIEALDPDPVTPLTDGELADQFTAMAWSLMKLVTLHRTIKPELLTTPNTLLTAEAADLGAADTTPDNLYMMGTFRLDPDQALVLDIEPPDTRYWNVTLENIWHECLEPRRRHSSVTSRAVQPDADGRVRIAISARGLRIWSLARHRRPATRIRGGALAGQPQAARRRGVGAPTRGAGVTLQERFNPARLIATACDGSGQRRFR